MFDQEKLKNVNYDNVSKVTENVYQFLNVSFKRGALCEDTSIISIQDSFPELYYYVSVNKFWVPLTSKRLKDRMIDRW